MRKYEGGIPLIAGLEPANEQDFPLVNAPDVQLDGDGNRLSDLSLTIDDDGLLCVEIEENEQKGN